MIFFLLIVITVLAIWVSTLSQRISKLEQNSVQNPIGEAEKVETENTTALPWEQASKAYKKSASKIKKVESKPFHLEDFLGKKLFPILGVTSMILAIGFFSVWAFANGWVGPMGRIALGIAFSVAVIVVGELMRNKYPNFFQYLTAVGIAGLIVTTFMARHNYEFISPIQSLLLYSLEAGAGVFLSLRYNARILGNFSILSGLVAPLLMNINELNVVGLLAFLTIICAAGTVLASYKKWPEIYAILIVFVIGFEFFSVDSFKEYPTIISPLALLGFIFGLHLLIGSGGLIRLYRENVTQDLRNPDPQDIYEVILFSVSLLTANLLAFNIFHFLYWDHFGFLVGFQALILYGLAEWFKQKGWSLFHVTALCSSLSFVFFATIWELRAEGALILGGTLIGQGVLLCFVGKNTDQKVFDFFGRLALFLASFFVLQIDSVRDSAILILILLVALAYSLKPAKDTFEKIWLGMSLILSSGMVFVWSFHIADLPDTLILLPSVVWSLLLLAGSFYKKIDALRWAAAIIFAINALVGLALLEGTQVLNEALIITSLIVVNGFSLYILQKTTTDESTENQIINYGSLSLMSLSVLTFSWWLLEEPFTTMIWILWAGFCLAIGMINRWVDIRYTALFIFLIIIAKLYLVDIWQWEIWVRFLAFFALGIALLLVGFFYQKLWQKK